MNTLDPDTLKASRGQLKYLGIHLAGSNSSRTAAVVVHVKNHEPCLVIDEVYEKICSFGSIFSDDRLLALISHKNLVEKAFIDIPLSLPPCGLCTRQICPGVTSCIDLAVAYISKLDAGRRSQGTRKKRRPLNPQSQRLWDVIFHQDERFVGLEPPYNAGKCQSVRVQALAKRLRSYHSNFQLLETSVPHVFAVFAHDFGFPKESCKLYRKFEQGSQHRHILLEEFLARGWLTAKTSEATLNSFVLSLDLFNAFICAVMNAWFSRGLLTHPPERLFEQQGWVYLPRYSPSNRESLKI